MTTATQRQTDLFAGQPKPTSYERPHMRESVYDAVLYLRRRGIRVFPVSPRQHYVDGRLLDSLQLTAFAASWKVAAARYGEKRADQ